MILKRLYFHHFYPSKDLKIKLTDYRNILYAFWLAKLYATKIKKFERIISYLFIEWENSIPYYAL